MGKQPRRPTGHTAEPMLSATRMPAEACVFPHGPADQKVVEMTEDRGQRGPIETSVVLNPATQDRIPHARQVVNGLVAPQGQPPAPHFLAHRGRRVRAHRRCEVDAVLAPSILRPPRAKRVSQEIEPLLRIPARPVVILAVDHARLAGMNIQPTLREPTSEALQDLRRRRLGPAVRDTIVCVPLAWPAGMNSAQPVVECEVQEDIRQQRPDHSALRRPLRPRHLRSILQWGGSFEPPLDVAEHPRALRVLPPRPENQFVVEMIEEAADVQVNDPGIAPASLPRASAGVERGVARPIALGRSPDGRTVPPAAPHTVCPPFEQSCRPPWECPLASRLRLSSVSRPYALGVASTFPTTCDSRSWRGCSSDLSRTPRSIQHRLQPLPDSLGLVRPPPPDLLGKTERLCWTHPLLPLARLPGPSSWRTRPLRSLGLFPISPLRRVAPSLCLASIRWPLGVHPWTSLFPSRRQVPTFRTKA